MKQLTNGEPGDDGADDYAFGRDALDEPGTDGVSTTGRRALRIWVAEKQDNGEWILIEGWIREPAPDDAD